MPKHRSILTLAALAALVLPQLAVAQPATPARPAVGQPTAPAPSVSAPATEDTLQRLRGAPTGRSGAATRGLGVPQDPPVTAPATPPTTGR